MSTAAAVASALDYAHRHNVIHRDIKPENILLHDGQALVADFGIALAVSQAGANRLTETGLSIGTPQYMSPEQAMGDREVDARSDVYSLGAMLYEMLAGDPPFTGSTAQAIVAKVITEKAPLVTTQRETVPAHVAAAIAKALSRLQADRFATAAEFADALTRPGAAVPLGTGESVALDATAVSPIARVLRGGALPWTLVGVAVALLAFVATRGREGDSAPTPVVRATVQLPANAYLDSPKLSFSDDGTRLVVAGRQDGRRTLLVHDMDALEFTAITGTEGAGNQVLSPDGQWVAFRAPDGMKKVLVDGGTPVTINDARWAGGDWSADGTLYFTQSYVSGIWRISADGGSASVITTPDSARRELGHWWPQLLPDGEHLLFTGFRTPIDSARIDVVSLTTGERKIVVQGGVSGRYIPTGHVIYARDEVLFAVPFDLGRLEVTGQAVPVVEDVAMSHQDGLAAFAVSEGGILAYTPASVYNADAYLVWVDRSGVETPVVPGAGRYAEPTLSPDGRQVALTVTRSGESPDVWVLEVQRGTMSRLTLGRGSEFEPVWTPSGDRVVFISERPVFDLYWRPANGSAPAVPLVVSEFDKYPCSFTPDGNQLVFTHVLEPRAEIWRVDVRDPNDPEMMLDVGLDLAYPTVSPDGRWLAFTSSETGRVEVYLVSYPNVAERRRQVSAEGGTEPRWTRGGRELVFRDDSRLMSVTVDPATGELGAPTVIFEGEYLYSIREARSYDVSSDGERFLMVKRPPENAPRQIVIVTNWFQELIDLMGTQ